MTTATAVKPKNMSNWVKSGTAVTATSASDVARQAGLDWSVSLHNMTASYLIPGTEQSTPLEVKHKVAVVKTTPFGDTQVIGVVGNRYQPFQNNEIFSALDSLIDSGDARYAAAGEYDWLRPATMAAVQSSSSQSLSVCIALIRLIKSIATRMLSHILSSIPLTAS